MASNSKYNPDHARRVLNEALNVVARCTDAPFVEDLELGDEDDFVINLEDTPPRVGPRTGYQPFILDALPHEASANPPTDKASTAWIVALLWLLCREVNVKTSGFLRKPGCAHKVRKLKEYVNQRCNDGGLMEVGWAEAWMGILQHGLDDVKFTVHDLVSTAKAYLLWLRNDDTNMPDSLVPKQHQKFWMEIVSNASSGDDSWITGAQHLLVLLPTGRCYLLKTVLRFLKIVCARPVQSDGSDSRQLDTKGIFTCFANCILQPHNTPQEITHGCTVVRALVENHDLVTKVPKNLVKMLHAPPETDDTKGATAPMQEPSADAAVELVRMDQQVIAMWEEQVAKSEKRILEIGLEIENTPKKGHKKYIKELKADRKKEDKKRCESAKKVTEMRERAIKTRAVPLQDAGNQRPIATPTKKLHFPGGLAAAGPAPPTPKAMKVPKAPKTPRGQGGRQTTV